jgi:hypothetical protein
VILPVVDIGTIAFIALVAWLGVFVVVLGLCKASGRADAADERRRTTAQVPVSGSEELIQLYRG